MKRTAAGLLAMTGISLAVVLSPAASASPAGLSLDQAPVAVQVSPIVTGTDSGSAAGQGLAFLLKCLTTGSGTPGTTGNGCLQ
ncbi:MAG: hypothetical protein JWN03_8829 [Nocardia sp.]|uniref:hypothetical protein n=1 Tax=Nocardia sp. TaxID=1821 RepID=UPI0026256493|nr:hypothetical protein [Nocardia sp.]MCU1648554.1 hypothetical protein [Nocardia sp.]